MTDEDQTAPEAGEDAAPTGSESDEDAAPGNPADDEDAAPGNPADNEDAAPTSSKGDEDAAPIDSEDDEVNPETTSNPGASRETDTGPSDDAGVPEQGDSDADGPTAEQGDSDTDGSAPEQDEGNADGSAPEDSDEGGPAIQSPADVPDPSGGNGNQPGVPDDVAKYDRFKKMDGAQYDRVNEFLRERTYVTAREWAIARLCADFRTETGVEMTKIGENLPELVPFMTDTYTPQAVNQARSAFDDKVRKAGATFLYGAMCDFYTAEELDDVMYEVTEVAKFLLEVEGIDLSVEEELDAEDQISSVMREVRESSAELRYEECPECGHELGDAG